MQLLHLDMSVIFQSTPSAWRETHAIVRVDAPNYISIHSLRMEGDCRSPIAALRILHFNPLPPHGGRPVHTQLTIRDLKNFNPLPPHGGRQRNICFRGTNSTFQSTPSAWRETWCFFLCHYDPEYFNPLPPHGGRQLRKAFILTGEKHFNPLPPHGGRRTRWRQSAETSRHFNPLPPHGGRQSSLNIFCIFNRHFNPLPPHGGRLLSSSS